MVADIRPLPAGVSGSLRPTEFEAAVHGDTAVTTYVADEDETFHGARIDSRYRMSETWVKRDGTWKLVASLVLALRSDPPARPTTAEQRRAFCGRYALGDLTYVVQCEAGGLIGGQAGRPPKRLELESPDVFFVPGEPRTRRFFQRDAGGPRQWICRTAGVLGALLEAHRLTGAPRSRRHPPVVPRSLRRGVTVPPSEVRVRRRFAPGGRPAPPPRPARGR